VRTAGILLGGASLLIPFVIFFKTMAPTLSFWDCGEFIACANTLGVPHPPGTPFFVVFGRVMIILGLFKNVAMRTNFLTVLGASFTTWLSYLIVVRVSRRLPFASVGSKRLGQIGIRIGALSSSLLMAFSSTYWFNSVETEIYGLAMFLMVLIIWLTIKWADEKEQGGSDKLLVFIVYMLFLSVGFHLTVFLILPAIFLYIILIDKTKLKDPIFWITWAIFFSMVVPFWFILGMMIPIIEDKSYWIWVVLMILGVIFSGYKAFGKGQAGGTRAGSWTLAFALFAAATLGYSTHLYIPIRAAQNPGINENNPSNFDRFEQYIERKQYGQESMISRMFNRRASLSHQFGRFQNMGFGGYFVDQYATHAGYNILRYIIFALGLFGIGVGFYLVRKKFPGHAMLLLFMIFLISSLGLILYLNFSDGTKPDPNNPNDVIPLEVRERDYFYTPAFVVFATIIGLGMAAGMYFLGDGLSDKQLGGKKFVRYALFGVPALGLLLLPLNPAMANYKAHDRSQDFAPADYGTNILQSCPPHSIIFTNGDNDTFPLWYLQEVEHIRNDVRIVNLSLLNTDWYILQLKHQMGIKMKLDDDQIAWIPAERHGSIIYYRPDKKFFDPVRHAERYLTAEVDRKSGQVIRVQDQMIEQIVLANLDSVPIYFSGSVPNSNRWTLGDYMIQQGIVLKVDPDTTKPRIDIPVYDSLITKIYTYRGLNRLDTYRDENNVGLTTTFPERFSELADAYKNIKHDTTKAISTLWNGVSVSPYYHQLYMDLIDNYKAENNSAMIDSVAGMGTRILKSACDGWSDFEINDNDALASNFLDNVKSATHVWCTFGSDNNIVLYPQFLGVLDYHLNEIYASDKGKADPYLNNALLLYKKAYLIQPDNSIAYRLLRDLNVRMGRQNDAYALMADWSQRHPEDLETRNYLNRMR
jgi:hypothetical protein